MSKSVYLAGLSYVLGEQCEPIQNVPGITSEVLEDLTAAGLRYYFTTTRHAMELAAGVCKSMLDKLRIDPERIDAIIFASNSIPSVELYQQQRIGELAKMIGASRAYPFGVFLSYCADLPVALKIARSLIIASEAENVLIVNTDTVAPSATRVVAPNISITSDAAACCLLTADAGIGELELLQASNYFDASLTMVDPHTEFTRYMEGTAGCIRTVAGRLLSALQKQPSDFRKLITNNYNKWVNTTIGNLAGFAENQLYLANISRFSHAHSADNIINLHDCLQAKELVPGDLLMMLASGPSMWGGSALRVL